MSSPDKILSVKNLVLRANRSEISSISTIITKILNIIKDPNASANQLRDIIEVDPPLCAKVLKRANSAYYGIKKNISSIQQAIVFLGFSTIKELALSLTVGNLFNNDNEIGHYSRKQLWKHSLAVSLCGKYIFRREFKLPGDEIYSTGLIHDIGIIIEEQFLKKHFSIMIEKSMEGASPIGIIQAENAVFGYHHGQVGKEITSLWQLPNEIVMPVAFHHMPQDAGAQYEKPAKVIHVADYICHKNNFGIEELSALDDSLYENCLKDLGISTKAVEIIFSDVKEELEELEEAGELYV